jgi:hypothetical protein
VRTGYLPHPRTDDPDDSPFEDVELLRWSPPPENIVSLVIDMNASAVFGRVPNEVVALEATASQEIDDALGSFAALPLAAKPGFTARISDTNVIASGRYRR